MSNLNDAEPVETKEEPEFSLSVPMLEQDPEFYRAMQTELDLRIRVFRDGSDSDRCSIDYPPTGSFFKKWTGENRSFKLLKILGCIQKSP